MRKCGISNFVLILLSPLAVFGAHARCGAETPVGTAGNGVENGRQEGEATSDASTKGFQKTLTAMVLEHLPASYEDKRHWGKTAQRWDGLHVRFDDFELKSNRRFKEVNHGDWTSYRIELIEPEKEFEFRLENLKTLSDGRIECDCVVASPLKCTARYARWQKGVQLISLTVESTARVALTVKCAAKASLELKHFPPDVMLRAEAMDANIELTEFRVQRVSRLGGEGAQLLGKAMRSIVVDRVEEKKDKLREKINVQFEKNAEKLRFSLRDLAASPWRDFMSVITPGEGSAPK